MADDTDIIVDDCEDYHVTDICPIQDPFDDIKEQIRLENLAGAQAILGDFTPWKMPKSPLLRQSRKNNKQARFKRRVTCGFISDLGEFLRLVLV